MLLGAIGGPVSVPSLMPAHLPLHALLVHLYISKREMNGLQTSLSTGVFLQEWGTGTVRPEQGLLRLRKEMQAFGNIRPCNFASESLLSISPLRDHVCRGVDFTVVRELTGGIYFGARKEAEPSAGQEEEAWDTERYTRPEIERITRLAGHLAQRHDPPLAVSSLDKANVLASSRLWRRVVSEIMAKEFPSVKISHQLIDSVAMLMVKDPRSLNGIVLTSNLFGDIISDESSVIPGSLGLLPSASLGAVPDRQGSRVKGIYEPIHGVLGPFSPFGKPRATNVAQMLTPSRYRLGPGHLVQEPCEPHRSHSIRGDDVPLLAVPVGRGRGDRGGGAGHYRQRCSHQGHWRLFVDHGRWRRDRRRAENHPATTSQVKSSLEYGTASSSPWLSFGHSSSTHHGR